LKRFDICTDDDRGVRYKYAIFLSRVIISESCKHQMCELIKKQTFA